MKNKSLLLTVVTAFAIGFGVCSTVNAANLSFTGTFSQDDDVQLFSFSLDAASAVTLRSYGYAGGTQSDGNVVADGGFDTTLALFDSTGVLLTQNDDGVGVPADPTTGGRYDAALFDYSLSAGNFFVALVQYDNVASGPNLSDGFLFDGIANFTFLHNPCDTDMFCDGFGGHRTNEWAFDIVNVTTASAVPLPAAVWLLGSGLLGLIGLTKRRRSASFA